MPLAKRANAEHRSQQFPRGEQLQIPRKVYRECST